MGDWGVRAGEREREREREKRAVLRKGHIRETSRARETGGEGEEREAVHTPARTLALHGVVSLPL